MQVRDLSIAYCLVAATYMGIGAVFFTSFPLRKNCIEDVSAIEIVSRHIDRRKTAFMRCNYIEAATEFIRWFHCKTDAFKVISILFYGCRLSGQNFLNNFTQSDVMTVAARVFLFFQMMTVFPLLAYILRSQVILGRILRPTAQQLTLATAPDSVQRLCFRMNESQVLYALFNSSYPSWGHVVALNVFLTAVCVLFAIFLPQIGTITRLARRFVSCSLFRKYSITRYLYFLFRWLLFGTFFRLFHLIILSRLFG